MSQAEEVYLEASRLHPHLALPLRARPLKNRGRSWPHAWPRRPEVQQAPESES